MGTATGSVSGVSLHFHEVVFNRKDSDEPDLEALSADLYTLDHNGSLQTAPKSTTNQLIGAFEAFDRSFYQHDDQTVGPCSSALSILRFEEATPGPLLNPGLLPAFHSQNTSRSQSRTQSVHRDAAQPTNSASSSILDLQKLRHSFDGKCLTVPYAPALRLKKEEPHCQWSNIKCPLPTSVRCLKISYSMRTPEPDSKALSLSHHFHTILGKELSSTDIEEENPEGSNGKGPEALHKSKTSPASLPTTNPAPPQDLKSSKPARTPNARTGLPVSKSFPQYLSKEMVRGFTTGLSKEEFEKIFYKAEIVEFQDFDSDLPGFSSHSKPKPHPKAILLGILEDFEHRQRDTIARHQSFIEVIADDIEVQRRPSNKNGNGLALCSIKLTQRNLYLGQMRPKLQYLSSAIEALQSCPGIPQSTEELIFLFPKKAIREKPQPERENYFGRFWAHQLSEINGRLLHLKGNVEQCKVNVETLQHRVTGNLLMVSNLLQQRENDWIHETEKHRTATSEYQVDMLQKQEVIATRTKRDGTVMKVLALLTAVFLPMTFIAVLFTIPFFKWDNPRGEWILKSPFILYWEVTMPMTAFMMVVFSIWFIRMWIEDRNTAREGQRKKIDREKEEEKERKKEVTATEENNEATEEITRRYLEVRLPEGEIQ